MTYLAIVITRTYIHDFPVITKSLFYAPRFLGIYENTGETLIIFQAAGIEK